MHPGHTDTACVTSLYVTVQTTLRSLRALFYLSRTVPHATGVIQQGCQNTLAGHAFSNSVGRYGLLVSF